MMIVRAALTVVLALALLAAPLAVDAQQAARVPRLGVVIPQAPPPARQPWLDGFREGLRELGYVEGRTILLEVRWTADAPDSTEVMASLVRLPVDVLVVQTTTGAMAAKRATTTIPIVTAAAGALVETGVVASLARPGGNVTGLTTQAADVSTKRFEVLKDLLPRLARVAAIRSPAGTLTTALFTQYAENGARAVGIQFQVLAIQTPADLDGAFQAAARSRVGAVITLPSPFFAVHAARVAEVALKHRLPLAGYYREEVEAGALMWYGVSRADMWRRAATYVDKILKGAKPADLPVEQPTKFQLVVNMKTARALGLTIPQSVLARADEVIE
jgi:putative ABC transport system substrate-binding protein